MPKNSKPPAKKPKTASKPAPKSASKSATKTQGKKSVPTKSAPKPASKAAPKTTKASSKAESKKPKVVAKAVAKADARKAPHVKTPAKGADAKTNQTGKKGITVVEQKIVAKKVKPPSAPMPLPPGVGRLLDGKGPRKPLIPSGPKAAHARPLGQHGGYEPDVEIPQAKSPFTPEELAVYREQLQRKRAELLADVRGMEDQALQSGSSGALSNMPSHLAEQGSEAYDQSLSLDLAAADRKLIREIDDAIARIDAGTFGICELTGKPIKLERLRELPWARYSIEAARELERQSMRG